MSARRLILFFDPVSTPLNKFKERGCPSQIGGNHGVHIQCILYIYIWAVLKTLGSRNGHPQIWKGPNRLPHVCTKMIHGKLGGYRLQENYIMIYLIPERRLCFLFDQASSLQDSELPEELLLEGVLCKSLFPNRQHAQTFARKMSDRLPVYLYLPFCLSAYLAS